MYTIKQEKTCQNVIKKSTFISYIYPIHSIEDTKAILATLKAEHKKATHVCYGFCLQEVNFEFDDDGEPQNSAGKPIVEIIKSHKLTDTMIVVVRYFGGVKLGIGGLVHAYLDSAKAVVEISDTVKKINRKKISIECGYDDYDKIKTVLQKNDCVFLYSEFFDNVFVAVEIEDLKYDEVLQKILDINYKIKINQA